MNKQVLALYTGLALIYIFIIPEDPFVLKVIFKLLPLIVLILYTTIQHSKTDSFQTRILGGLCFCMLGDFLIAVYFPAGLGAFLIGHLFYIGSFLRRFSFSTRRAAVLLPLTLYAFLIGRELAEAVYQETPALTAPVIGYIAVITVMGWSAFMTGRLLPIAGSLFFLASDSILAWNMFITPVPASNLFIMSTYYAAQLLIASSATQAAPLLENKKSIPG